MNWQDVIEQYFPSALPGMHLTSRAGKVLQRNGFDPLTTLLATSTCPDELNRAVTSFQNKWGPAYQLGGMAGLPFTGQQGFENYAVHIPDGGTAFVVYASHVGITRDRELGRVQREGHAHTTSSCASAVVAYEHLRDGGAPEDMNGQQQAVTALIQENWDRLDESEVPLATLPSIIFNQIQEDLHALIPPEFPHRIALLGGIQINTPNGNEDYFLVRDFRIECPAERESEPLMDELRK